MAEKIEDLIFFSVSAFDNIPRADREILMARFSDITFMRFLDEQEKAAQQQLTSINPDSVDESSDDFRQRVRKATAIWRFWSDFKTYIAQFARST